MDVRHQPKTQEEVHKKRSRRTVKIMLVLCFVSLGTMCLFIFGIVWLFRNPPKAVMMRESGVYEMNFSLNGKRVGFVRENTWHIPWMEAPIEKREVHFCWRDVAVEGNMKSAKVDSAGDEYERIFSSLPMSFRFSPDSKYAAVASIYNFSLVNLNTGELSRISRPREAVTSFQWLTNNEIGYVVHSGGNRYFWRQKVNEDANKRKSIYRSEGSNIHLQNRRLIGNERSEYWSPHGRYVVLNNQILDVTSEKIVATMDEYFSGLVVAWKVDESEAFLIDKLEEEEGQAFLVQLPSGDVIDCSARFKAVFEDREPSILPYWTCDGQYVLVNDYIKLGACLIRPDPWEVIDITSKLANHIAVDERCKPTLFWMPFGGWIGVNAMTDNESWWAAPKYAIDYEVKRVILLWKEGGVVALSPDGRLVAVCSNDKDILIREVSIPINLESPEE